MKFLIVVSQKKIKDFANKRQFKHTTSSLKPSVLFHSLVNTADSDDITLEKSKTQKLSLEINLLPDNFHQYATVKTLSPQTPQIHAEDPNNKSKPHFFQTLLFLL